MPLPSPQTDEGQDDFMARCHSELADEFEDRDQRHAVCMTQWRDQKSGQESRDMDQKAYVPFEVKTIDQEAREFSGYASTWDVDLEDERFAKGAWKQDIGIWRASQKTDEARIIPLVDLHNYRSVRNVFGKVTALEEDDRGLFIKGQIIDTPDGEEYMARIRAGFLNGLSVGFDSVQDREEKTEDGKKVRVITKAKLREVSAVIWGANPSALIAAAKSMVKDDKGRESVEGLRDRLTTLLGDDDETKAAPPAVAPEEPAEPESAPVEPEPEEEKEEPREPTPMEAAVLEMEADIEALEEQKQMAVETEHYHDARILADRIAGLKSKIKRHKRLIEDLKKDPEHQRWTPHARARLETEALLAKSCAHPAFAQVVEQ